MLTKLYEKVDHFEAQIASRLENQTGVNINSSENSIADIRKLRESLYHIQSWLTDTKESKEEYASIFGDLIKLFFQKDRTEFDFKAGEMLIERMAVVDFKEVMGLINSLSYALAYKSVDQKLVSYVVAICPNN